MMAPEMVEIPTTEDACQLLHEGAIALSQVERNGIRIDVDYLKKARKRIAVDVADLEDRLKESKIWRVWEGEYGSKAKLTSDTQLGQIWFGKLGNKCGHFTATLRPKVSKDVMERVNDPFVKDWIRYKKLIKTRSTYIKGILDEVVDGLLHCMFHLHTVRTFRSSSSLVNFQNFPIRDVEIGELIRSAFIPREGRTLLEIDFKVLEVCIGACYHKDPGMIAYIEDPKKDMHRDMASEIFKVDMGAYPEDMKGVKKKVRYCAKNMFVFPQFYGDFYVRNADSLWHAIQHFSLKAPDGTPLRKWLKEHGIKSLGACDPDQSPKSGTFERHLQEIEEDFWENRFPVYALWKKKEWALYLKRGWFDLFTGFREEGIMSRNDVANHRIQGSAFHCLLWTLIQLQKWLRKERMESLIVGQIHDSTLLDAVKGEIAAILAKVNEIVTVDLPKHWPWICVPLSVEAEASEVNWHLKKEIAA